MVSDTHTPLQNDRAAPLSSSTPHAFGATIIGRVRAASLDAAMLDAHLLTTHTYSSITHTPQNLPSMAFQNGPLDDNNYFRINSRANNPTSNFSPRSPTGIGPPLYETKEALFRTQRRSKHTDESSILNRVLDCMCLKR